MPKFAPALEITPKDKRRLQSWARYRDVPAAVAQRARIVLLASDGHRSVEIAERLGVSSHTVNIWRKRYREGGVNALVGRPRPHKARQIDPLEIVAKTLEPPPTSLGVTHWSTRLLAAELGVSNATVAKVWQEYGLSP